MVRRVLEGHMIMTVNSVKNVKGFKIVCYAPGRSICSFPMPQCTGQIIMLISIGSMHSSAPACNAPDR